ncbi:hypothetical protein ACFQ60_45905 [Streptomyces zhihengii]
MSSRPSVLTYVKLAATAFAVTGLLAAAPRRRRTPRPGPPRPSPGRRPPRPSPGPRPPGWP